MMMMMMMTYYIEEKKLSCTYVGLLRSVQQHRIINFLVKPISCIEGISRPHTWHKTSGASPVALNRIFSPFVYKVLMDLIGNVSIDASLSETSTKHEAYGVLHSFVAIVIEKSDTENKR